MRHRVVLFDLDGTLTDPLVGIANSIRYALVALGLPPRTDSELREWVGPPLRDSFVSIGVPRERVIEAVDLYRDYFADRGLFENEEYEGIRLVLTELRAADVRLAVATSKPTVFADRILEHFALAAHFEHVVGAELDGSRDHKFDVIVEALARLGEPKFDTVAMVGDRAQDIHAAKQAGVTPIGVAWGYAGAGELEDAGATVVATTRDELLRILLNA